MSWRESTREAEGLGRGLHNDSRVFIRDDGWMVLRMGLYNDEKPWGIGCPIPGVGARNTSWGRRRFGSPEKAMAAVDKNGGEWLREAKNLAISAAAREARQERSQIDEDLNRLRRIFERYESVMPHYIETKLKARMDELDELIRDTRNEKYRELEEKFGE